MRVVNPTDEAIHGLALTEVPHANKTLPGEFRPGWAYNFGGIAGEVVRTSNPRRASSSRSCARNWQRVLSASMSPCRPSLLAAHRWVVDVLVSEAQSGIDVAKANQGRRGARLARGADSLHLELQVPRTR